MPNSQHQTVWQRSKDDTNDVLKSAPFVVASFVLGALGGAASLIATSSDVSMRTVEQVGWVILAGVGIPVVALLLVFAFQFLAAPVRQRNEAREAESTAQSELERLLDERSADDGGEEAARVAAISALNQIRDELRTNYLRVQKASQDREYPRLFQLAAGKWDAYGAALDAPQFTSLRDCLAEAYIRSDTLNRHVTSHYVELSETAVLPDDGLEPTLHAIETALAQIEPTIQDIT